MSGWVPLSGFNFIPSILRWVLPQFYLSSLSPVAFSKIEHMRGLCVHNLYFQITVDSQGVEKTKQNRQVLCTLRSVLPVATSYRTGVACLSVMDSTSLSLNSKGKNPCWDTITSSSGFTPGRASRVPKPLMQKDAIRIVKFLMIVPSRYVK